jgi:hypothetical protein
VQATLQPVGKAGRAGEVLRQQRQRSSQRYRRRDRLASQSGEDEGGLGRLGVLLTALGHDPDIVVPGGVAKLTLGETQ